jgi:hypothetical protein
MADELLQALTGVETPFGGKFIVFVGDFRQIPPVDEGTNDTSSVSAVSAPWWKHVQTTVLSVNHRRQQQEQLSPNSSGGDRAQEEFSNYVEQIGVGFALDPLTNTFVQRDGYYHTLPPATPQVTTHADLYAAYMAAGSNPQTLCNRNIVAFTNELVDRHNDSLLSLCSETMHQPVSVLYGAHSYVSTSANPVVHILAHDSQFAERRMKSSVPPSALRLCVGTVVSCLRNLDDKIHNSTKMIVEDISPFLITARLTTGETVHLPRFLFDLKPSGHRRRQFPLKLAYATTANRVQGLTLDFVGVDASSDAFAHGALFVAVSRVRNHRDCVIFIPDRPGPRTVVARTSQRLIELGVSQPILL